MDTGVGHHGTLCVVTGQTATLTGNVASQATAPSSTTVPAIAVTQLVASRHSQLNRGDHARN